MGVKARFGPRGNGCGPLGGLVNCCVDLSVARLWGRFRNDTVCATDPALRCATGPAWGRGEASGLTLGEKAVALGALAVPFTRVVNTCPPRPLRPHRAAM